MHFILHKLSFIVQSNCAVRSMHIFIFSKIKEGVQKLLTQDTGTGPHPPPLLTAGTKPAMPPAVTPHSQTVTTSIVGLLTPV